MYTMITAHSGCDGTPDNSLEFVAHALTCGADALEVDVRVREDGTLYLSHDLTDALRPTLEEVFRLLQGSSMKINCDLKEPDLELPVRDLAVRLGVWEQVLYSGEVSTGLMLENEEVSRRTLLNYSQLLGKMDPTGIDHRLDELVEACRRFGARTVNFYYRLFTDPVLERLGQEGIQVSAWTVNDPETALRLLQKGVYNITSRKPGMVERLRQEL